MAVSFNGKHLAKFIRPEEYEAIYPQVELAHKQLETKTGVGNDFLGWLDLPVTMTRKDLPASKKLHRRFVRFRCAARRRYRRLLPGCPRCGRGRQGPVSQRGRWRPEDLLLRQHHQPTALNDIIKLTKGKRFSINVISKSGTTTETALAFRVLRKLLEDSVGVEEANKRIYATTDRAKGTLKQLATEQGWPTFVVPDDVGGRYSVLTAVGLLPIACAGIDIDELMQGAAEGREVWQAVPGQRCLPLRHDPQHPVPQGQERRDAGLL